MLALHLSKLLGVRCVLKESNTASTHKEEKSILLTIKTVSEQHYDLHSVKITPSCLLYVQPVYNNRATVKEGVLSHHSRENLLLCIADDVSILSVGLEGATIQREVENVGTCTNEKIFSQRW